MSPDFNWTWNGTEWVPSQAPTLPPLGVAWARPYESAGFRATAVTIFLLANAAALFIGIVFDLVLVSLGADLTRATEEQALAVGLLALVYLVILYGTYVPCVVLFCMWLHRVVRNMPALGSSDARWSPSGAVWRSFIPIFSWFHPLMSTLDAWRASNPSRRFIDVRTRRAIGVPMLFAGWWALWLIGNFSGSVGLSLANNDNFDLFTFGTGIHGLGNVLLIVAAGLAIMVVREVTQRQDRKNELITTGQLA